MADMINTDRCLCCAETIKQGHPARSGCREYANLYWKSVESVEVELKSDRAIQDVVRKDYCCRLKRPQHKINRNFISLYFYIHKLSSNLLEIGNGSEMLL